VISNTFRDSINIQDIHPIFRVTRSKNLNGDLDAELVSCIPGFMASLTRHDRSMDKAFNLFIDKNSRGIPT
jgi:hypothetical protein